MCGDKAYPLILLPSGWHLHVTMTAKEDDVDVQKGVKESEKYLEKKGESRKFVHTIADDPKRYRTPEIALDRAVVERVIQAIKSWKWLANVPWLSKQNQRDVYVLVVVIAAICNWTLRRRKSSW